MNCGLASDNVTLGQMEIFNKKLFGQAIRFCIVGVMAVAIHYAIYLLLKQWIVNVVAFAIGYFISFIANFFMTLVVSYPVTYTLCYVIDKTRYFRVIFGLKSKKNN